MPSSVDEQVEEFARFFQRVKGAELEGFQRDIMREVFSGRREMLVTMGRGNGKTSLFAVVALHHLLTTKEPHVYLAASSTDQASIAYDSALDLVRSHPALSRRIKALPGYKLLRLKDRPGFVKVISSDAYRAHGLMPSLCLVDELHAHQNDKLYVALRTALGKRPDAQLVTISTAGYDPDGALARLRQAALKLDTQERVGSMLRCESDDGKFVMMEWACVDGDDTDDPAVLKKANPASFVSEEFLREQISTPGLHLNDRLRFHANMWVQALEAWLPPGSWDRCFEDGVEIPDGSPVYLGVDIGLKKDSSAVVCVFPRDDGAMVVKARVLDPPGDGTSLDLALVEQEIRGLANRFQVLEVAYDRWSFERSAQMLSDEGLQMTEFPLSNDRMVPASQRLYDAIASGRVRHDGDPVLASHVLSGVTTGTERGWRIGKKKALNKIDALIALVLAFARADDNEGGPPVLEWIA